MKSFFVVLSLVDLFGCAAMSKDPEVIRQRAATERFETCMDATMPSFGPIKVATADQRAKAAEICKDVMRQ
jgi:hypothetical protein